MKKNVSAFLKIDWNLIDLLCRLLFGPLKIESCGNKWNKKFQLFLCYNLNLNRGAIKDNFYWLFRSFLFATRTIQYFLGFLSNLHKIFKEKLFNLSISFWNLLVDLFRGVLFALKQVEVKGGDMKIYGGTVPELIFIYIWYILLTKSSQNHNFQFVVKKSQ